MCDVRFDDAFRRELLLKIPKLRAFARSLARHDQDGDDLAQTTVMKAWRSRRDFELGTDLMRWLHRILRNEHISSVRASRRRGQHGPEGAENLPAPDDPHTSLECVDLLRAIRALPLALRESLLLVAVGGASYEEAAALMKCPIGTVKTRVFRARVALTDQLQAAAPIPSTCSSQALAGRSTRDAALRPSLVEEQEVVVSAVSELRERHGPPTLPSRQVRAPWWSEAEAKRAGAGLRGARNQR